MRVYNQALLSSDRTFIVFIGDIGCPGHGINSIRAEPSGFVPVVLTIDVGERVTWCNLGQGLSVVEVVDRFSVSPKRDGFNSGDPGTFCFFFIFFWFLFFTSPSWPRLE